MIDRTSCVGNIGVKGTADFRHTGLMIMGLSPNHTAANLTKDRGNQLLANHRMSVEDPAQMDGVNIAAGGTDAAADAHVFINMRDAAAQAARGLSPNLFLGKRGSIILKGQPDTFVAGNLAAGIS